MRTAIHTTLLGLSLIFLALTGTGHASVSITASNVINVRNETGEEVPVGTLGLVVVDTGNDGFQDLSPSSIRVGDLLGDGNPASGNDWIVHRIAYGEAFGQRFFSLGQGGLSFNLEVSTPPGSAAEGDAVALYWFPELTIDDVAIGEGQSYGVGREDHWLVPGDGAAVSFGKSDTQRNADLAVGEGGNRLDPSGDPDFDGIANLLEAAFGGDPHKPDVEILPVTATRDQDGQEIFEIRYRQLAAGEGGAGEGTVGVDYAVGGYRYAVEISDDLQTWRPGAEFVKQSGALVDNGDGTETAIVRILRPPAENVSRYARVIVAELP